MELDVEQNRALTKKLRRVKRETFGATAITIQGMREHKEWWLGQANLAMAAHLSSPLAQRMRADYGLAIPSLKEVHEQAAATDPYGLEEVFLFAARHGRMSWGSTVEEWAHVESQMPDIFDRIIFANEPVEQVTTEIARRIDEILATPGGGSGIPRSAGFSQFGRRFFLRVVAGGGFHFVDRDALAVAVGDGPLHVPEHSD